MLFAAYSLIFLAIFIFVLSGYRFFISGSSLYQESYLTTTAQALESIHVRISPLQLLYLSLTSALLVATIIFVLFNSFTMAVLFGLPALALPKLLERILKKRMYKKFGQQFVEALDSLSNALKTGYSLPQAIEMVGREMPAPLGHEFALVIRELQLGAPLGVALGNMAKRIPNEDLSLVTSAVSISQEVGGNLAEVFEKIAKTIRERVQIEGKIDALTSQGKLQGIVVALMPLALGYVLNLINPELMRPMYTTPLGWCMIMAIVVLELLGYFFIRKIVAIEV